MNKANLSHLVAVLLLMLCSCSMAGNSAKPASKTLSNNQVQVAMNNNDTGNANSRRIVSYNVENLFDTSNDPNTADDDFTPHGSHSWTQQRYNNKLNHIARVIIDLKNAKGELPILVGLCEVENDYVLRGLTQFSPLKSYHYKFVHQDSPDPRGIDCALLYRPSEFKLISSDFINVKLGHNTTRDILHAVGCLTNGDTLHAFVVHLPSRRNGQEASEWKRTTAAQTLMDYINNIHNDTPKARIIVMGDFNDNSDNKSIAQVLEANQPVKKVSPTALYDITAYLSGDDTQGSYKHSGQWTMLDHILVSGNLLIGSSDTHTAGIKAHIFTPPYLLHKDSRNGDKPNRTYTGYKYHKDGYSDHLPIYLDLVIQ